MTDPGTSVAATLGWMRLALIFITFLTVGCGSGSSSGRGEIQGGIALTKLSFDPYTNTDAQHETANETNIVSHGSTLVAGFHSARLIGGGVTNIGWAVSHDSGATWDHGVLPHTTVYAGGSMSLVTDPVVAYDAKHSIWMLSFIGQGSPQNAAYVALSQDDGKTFGDPVVIAAGGNPDKNWTACDNYPSSPNYGNCYTEYDDDSTAVVYLSRSSDGGRTWSPIQSTPDQYTGIAGFPIVLPTGRVVVPIINHAYTVLSVFYSDNGGVSWSNAQTISKVQTAAARAGLRESPNPSVAIDAAGKLYLTWYDCQFDTNCQANSVVLSTSTDGVTWSAPIRVPTFSSEQELDHLFPGIGADTAGRIGITFYTVSAGACLTDENACRINAYYIASSNGGASWSAPVLLGGPMEPSWISTTARGRMFGDYTGLAFSNQTAFPVFSLALQPQTQQYNQGVYTFPQR